MRVGGLVLAGWALALLAIGLVAAATLGWVAAVTVTSALSVASGFVVPRIIHHVRRDP